jgi:endonuclease YncB( thermonuclease family)
VRQAHKVWLAIAAGVFVLVAAVDLSTSTPPTPSSASSSSSATSTPRTTSTTTTTTTAPSSYAAAPTTSSTPAAAGTTATVTDVVDGDTIEISGGRRVRLLGIDACEMSTQGGREAKQLLEGFVGSDQVRLVTDGSRDHDRYGRLLRRVETTTGSTDIGALMVIYPTVGVYEGQNDATPAYLAQLRASDDGRRDCSGTPTVGDSGSDGDVDVDVHVGDGDDGLPDGALTGGYCARKWWC